MFASVDSRLQTMNICSSCRSCQSHWQGNGLRVESIESKDKSNTYHVPRSDFWHTFLKFSISDPKTSLQGGNWSHNLKTKCVWLMHLGDERVPVWSAMPYFQRRTWYPGVSSVARCLYKRLVCLSQSFYVPSAASDRLWEFTGKSETTPGDRRFVNSGLSGVLTFLRVTPCSRPLSQLDQWRHGGHKSMTVT